MASGYKILIRYEVAYRRALESHSYDDNPIAHPVYAVPCAAYPDPPLWQPKYRGIDREDLPAMTDEDARMWSAASPGGSVTYEATPATRFLRVVELKTGREDGWVTSMSDILAAWTLLGPAQDDYEIVFGRESGDSTDALGHEFLGCDAAYWEGDRFSCICDALFFPRWHGTDPEGVLFLPHFQTLNANGLFDTNTAALGYLEFYTSFPWTERDEDFTSIEVYAVDPLRDRW